MSFLFFDDSKHHKRGFSLATFVVCETDPQQHLMAIIQDNRFDPATFEFKSSLSMKDNPSLRSLRADLKHYMQRNCDIAVCVVSGDKNLGPAGLSLLKKMLNHDSLISSTHSIFFDEGLFSSKVATEKLSRSDPELNNCIFHFEQDSKQVLGIQVADLAAHTCATMLSVELGFINKKVRLNEPGYPYNGEIDLGFELWAHIRYCFLGTNKTDDFTHDDFAMKSVEPYGLFVHQSTSKAVSKAALDRFGEIYLGCIH